MTAQQFEKSPLAKVLDGWYAGRAWFPLLRSQTLSVPERLVLSALVSRERNGLHSNPSSLRSSTCLDRNETIPRALRNLRDHHDLIAWDEETGLMVCREPKRPNVLFHTRRCAWAKSWTDHVAYDRYYVPAEGSPLTIADNVVLWTLTGRSRDGLVVQGQNQAGIAAMTGYSRRHVGRVLAKLERMGFVIALASSCWGLNPPDAVRLAMFWLLAPTLDSSVTAVEDHIRRVKETTFQLPPGPDDRREAILNAITDHKLTPEVCEILEELDARNFTPEEIRFVLDAREALGHDQAIRLFNQASQQHRRKHGADAHNCFALFRYKYNKLFGRA